MRNAPAVVIVTHRGGSLLARCVSALADQTLAPSRVRVVVSSRELVAVPDGVEVDHLGENVGFARAANAGLRATGGPVVLLNDDTRPRPHFLERLAAAVDGPGVYQPCILLGDGSGRLDNTGHRLFPDGFNLARGRGRPDAGPAASERGRVGAFSGAAVLFSAEVLTDVGLFDEALDAFGEDVDLSLRALRRGFAIRYVPDAEVLHDLGATYGRVSARKVFLVERNRIRAAVRSMPASALLTMPLWTAMRVGALGAAAASGRGIGADLGVSEMTAAMAGGLAGLAATPDAWRKRRSDRRDWALGELGMWRTLLRHRVRTEDLVGTP